MQQLSGLDTGFLTMETATQFGHVGGLYVFEEGAGFEATRDQIERRLHLLPPYRRQLVEVTFGLDNPYWIESPNFDLDFHVREIAVPPPGTREQLADLVARLAARPMDRGRPLWEWYVIEGLEGGDVAHYAKTHHASIDGASGTEMMTVLLDDSPDGRVVEPPAQPWKPERVPSDMELLGMTLMSYMRRPGRMARAQVRLMREMADRSGSDQVRNVVRQVTQPLGAFGEMFGRRRTREPGDDPPELPLGAAPRTPWNATITAHRRWSYCTLSLDDVKRVKSHHDVTVNDVVLAICAGALRRYLDLHRALPTDPLTAMCPVSIRTGSESDKYSNRVSGMIVSLATNIEDPVKRLAEVNRSTVAAKAQFNAMPADALQDFAQFAPPAVMARASRMLSRARIADRINSPINVTISNVPGPRHPLYMAGARLKHSYPVSMVTDGMGLNITVTSYMDNMDFGIIACRELVPDLWVMNDHLADALEELLATVP
jgi:diacylglycerol O-acyltransferase / wax synthase